MSRVRDIATYGGDFVAGLRRPMILALSSLTARAAGVTRIRTDRMAAVGIPFERRASSSLLREALGATDGIRRVEVDGVSLAYSDGGDGPVVLCLHAIGHGARDYEPLAGRLRKNYRVIALDWPGHGRSAPDPKPASIVRYAGLLEGFVAALGLSGVVLVGNSIGGGAAIRFAAGHASLVHGLVVENPAGLIRIDSAVRAVTRSLSRLFAAGAAGAPWFPVAFAAYYRMVLPSGAAAEQRARIVAAGVESAPVLAQAWASFGDADSDLRATASGLRAPVLVTWSMRDRLNPLARSRTAIERIPGVRVEEYDGGHSPHLEQLDAFETSLRAFLTRIYS
jgi:4,5:9,10-diseco-3-hydroxy-5,9,17-trioxoandrosta-1(10),2-diene-4-oate hydrolase